MKNIVACLISSLLLPISAHAETLWSDNSLSLLYGGDYYMVPAGENSRVRTMTLEHASGHTWGKTFLFIDRLQEAQGNYRETYGEISPTLYLKTFESGVIKSINAAFTYEFGSSTTQPALAGGKFSQDNYLAGVGLSFSIHGMDFLDLNLYHAWDNTIFERREDDQLSLSYGWHQGNFNVDGFVDFVPAKTGKNTELNITPQLTYNLAPLLGLKNKLKVGVEYAYWKNKFGASETQNNVSLLVKWHL